MLAAITYRMRPMNQMRMCFDCRMVQRVVSPILLLHIVRNSAVTTNYCQCLRTTPQTPPST
jgi:hypothetical protein